MSRYLILRGTLQGASISSMGMKSTPFVPLEHTARDFEGLKPGLYMGYASGNRGAVVVHITLPTALISAEPIVRLHFRGRPCFGVPLAVCVEKVDFVMKLAPVDAYFAQSERNGTRAFVEAFVLQSSYASLQLLPLVQTVAPPVADRKKTPWIMPVFSKHVKAESKVVNSYELISNALTRFMTVY